MTKKPLKSYYDEAEFYCPHCGETMDFDWPTADDPEQTYQCSSCEKRFSGLASITYSASIDCVYLDKVHEWVPHKLMDGFDGVRFVECKVCGEWGNSKRLQADHGNVPEDFLKAL